jgi:hypothetical protein
MAIIDSIDWKLVVTGFGAVAGLIKWLHAEKKLRNERKQRSAVEAELREVQRRGRAPFLRATALHAPKTATSANQIVFPGKAVDPCAAAS